MKKRITCMLLALCMVLAAVPAAVAAPAVEDQIDVALLEKHLGNELQVRQAEVAVELQEEAAEPMDARASGNALIYPHMSCVDQYRLIGDLIHLAGFAYVPETALGQNWYIELYAGADPTEDGYLNTWYGTFDEGAGSYDVSVDLKTTDLGTGTYTVFYFIGQGDTLLEDTITGTHVYVTNDIALMTRSFFADASQDGFPEVKKICVPKGYLEESNYCLRVEPANTTDNRYAEFTSSNTDMLEVDDFGGFLMMHAKQYGTATVSVDNIRKNFTISVEICTDDQGHDYSKEVVVSQPTCTEAGLSQVECTKCGHWKSSKTTPALGHAWDAGQITKEETEDTWGEKFYTCTRCGETKTAPYHTCPSAMFTDMPVDTNWAHKGIDYCVKHELMMGVGSNRFAPASFTTRAQLVTVLWRMAGSPEPEATAPFVDLGKDPYYEKAVTWAYEQDVTKGVTETEFRPHQLITREQMTTFFYRFAEYILELDVSAREDITSFPDHNRVSDYAKDCMSWAYSVGLIYGVPSGSANYLQPQNSATRAQIATVLMRFCENIVPEASETPEA